MARAGAGVQGDPAACIPITPLWRDFAYEYEFGKLAIDVINGGPGLREWVDDTASIAADLDALTRPDELRVGGGAETLPAILRGRR